MLQPFSSLWSLIEVPHPLLAADDLKDMGAERQALEAIGFLVPAAKASHIVCPECHDDHVVEVSRVRQRGQTRFFITCPEAGWCEVAGDLLRQWSIDCDAVAKELKGALEPSGRRRISIPGRLWRLGKTGWQQTSRDLLFARGLTWPDADDAIRVIEKATQPIVLVPDQIPDFDIWTKRVPPVVSLSQITHLRNGKLDIDRAHLFAAVMHHEEVPVDSGAGIISTKKQTLMMRRAVKEELRSHLQDDILVAAYKKYGSYNKAAAGLTAEGYETNRWAVERAVKRAGGNALAEARPHLERAGFGDQ